MKRIVAILMICTLGLGLLAGCGSSNQDQGLSGVQGGTNVPVGDGGAHLPQQEEQTPDGGAEQTPNGGEEQTPNGGAEQTPNGGAEQTPDGGAEQTPDGGAEQPSNQGGGQTSNNSIDYTADGWITVCSYNIKSLHYDENVSGGGGGMMSKVDAVCEQLEKIDADIVGMQEVNRFSDRGGPTVDQLETLAERLGYPYFYFTPTVAEGRGHYGHGVMSRYKLTKTESYYFKDYGIDAAEPRGFSRCEMKVDGKTLVLYNAHLAGKQAQQVQTISSLMEADKRKGNYAVFTGDMNAKPPTLEKSVNAGHCTVLNTAAAPQPTTYDNGNPIDNIVVTNNLKYYWDAANKTGIKTIYSNASDHFPVYTYIRFK